MTRPPLELLRDVAKALAGYGSLKHTQAKFPQHPGIQAALLEKVAYIEALEREVREALRAQAEAGAAEVWMETGHAELVSITRCVTAQMWDDLRIDLMENAPDLPEGLYTVPVGRDSTDPTGEASATHTYYLDWDRAALAQADAADGAGGAGGAGCGVSGECGICERNMRGPHEEDCPYYTPPLRCECGGVVGEEWACEACGRDCWADMADAGGTGGAR